MRYSTETIQVIAIVNMPGECWAVTEWMLEMDNVTPKEAETKTAPHCPRVGLSSGEKPIE
jgi:hypothetical protein